MLLLCHFLYAQNPSDVKRIDSIAGVISEKATNNKHKIVEGTLLLDDNKTSSIRFHLDREIVEMIVVESNLKDDVAIYFFDNGKILYVANFANGNYNEIENSVYFTDKGAYRKQTDIFKLISSDVITAQVLSYFDLFKEQLKTK